MVFVRNVRVIETNLPGQGTAADLMKTALAMLPDHDRKQLGMTFISL
jgi:hypothetical protein